MEQNISITPQEASYIRKGLELLGTLEETDEHMKAAAETIELALAAVEEHRYEWTPDKAALERGTELLSVMYLATYALRSAANGLQSAYDDFIKARPHTFSLATK